MAGAGAQGAGFRHRPAGQASSASRAGRENRLHVSTACNPPGQTHSDNLGPYLAYLAEQHGRATMQRLSGGASAGADGGRPTTEVRGQRRAAPIRKYARRHARGWLPLLYIAGSALGPFPVPGYCSPRLGRRGHRSIGQGWRHVGKSRGWRNGPNGEAEQALLPTQIPHSGYPWVIPACHKRKRG
jgi:hypothetical protein